MRLVIVTAWILLGAALAGGAYWGFLNTPESTAVALIVSALLVVLTMVLVAITINGAISLWVHGPSAAALRRSFGSAVSRHVNLPMVGVVRTLRRGCDSPAD